MPGVMHESIAILIFLLKWLMKLKGFSVRKRMLFQSGLSNLIIYLLWKKRLCMSDRNPSLLITDILNCINRIQLYTQNCSFDDFTANFMVAEACLYNLHVIGEAVTKLPDDVKDPAPHVSWKLIKGMRNRLIHE